MDFLTGSGIFCFLVVELCSPSSPFWAILGLARAILVGPRVVASIMFLFALSTGPDDCDPCLMGRLEVSSLVRQVCFSNEAYARVSNWGFANEP